MNISVIYLILDGPVAQIEMWFNDISIYLLLWYNCRGHYGNISENLFLFWAIGSGDDTVLRELYH